jgi:hypothetical protein
MARTLGTRYNFKWTSISTGWRQWEKAMKANGAAEPFTAEEQAQATQVRE